MREVTNMLTDEGVYQNGKIELLESVEGVRRSKVLVTFVDSLDQELASLGIDESEAAVLRHKFATFEDWNDPEMYIYNDYDNAKAALDKSRRTR